MENPDQDSDSTAVCPRCGETNPNPSENCPSCGAFMRARLVRASPSISPVPPPKTMAATDFSSIATSAWIALAVLLVGVVALFMPWRTYDAFVIHLSQNGFQTGAPGVLTFILILAASILIAIRLGFKSFTEILPSGEQLEVPRFGLWMTLICVGIVGSPLLIVAFSEASSGAGAWLEMIAGVVLWFTSLSTYERSS